MTFKGTKSGTDSDMRCVHCCILKGKESKDHVFPTSWYPETTPVNVQRWTVPSCRECNRRLGKIERELFMRLALCVDPRRAEASGLAAKALRSMGVRADGISIVERIHRTALKLKIRASMSRVVHGMGTLPGLGVHPGFAEEEQYSIQVPSDQLHSLGEKVIRGCEYVLGGGRFVEAPYSVKIFFVHAGDVPPQVVAMFEGVQARTTNLGPGFIVQRIAAFDEPNAVMYKIAIWGSLVIYGTVTD
jgi:hypothetical protein